MVIRDEKINEFNKGGKHEQNPYGGIPQGIGVNGKMNTVEEGETSYDFKTGKFIFSDRIDMKNKKELNKEFYIPGWVKGNTPAEEVKSIKTRFKDRKSKVDLETMEGFLKAVADKQEYIKMSNPEKYGSQPNQSAYGGRTPVSPVNELNPLGSGPGAGAYAGAASTAIDFANTAFGDTGIDTSGAIAAPTDLQTRGGGAISGVMKGASAGASFGPWGAAIGGVVGGVSGLLGAGKAKRDANKARGNYDANLSNQYAPDTYNSAYGGKIFNSYSNGGKIIPAESGKAIHLPEDSDPNREADLITSYANRKQLSNTQVEGFKEQRINDRKYTIDKLSFLKDYQKNWLKQSGNRNFSQVSPEYQNMMSTAKKEWFNTNPRVTNDIVTDYRENGHGGVDNNYARGGPLISEYKNDNFLTNLNSIFNKTQRTKAPKELYQLPDKFGYNKEGSTSKTGDFLRGVFKAPNGVDEQGNALKSKAGDALNFLNKNASTIGELAPIIGNLTNKIKPIETKRGVRLGNVFKPLQFDEARLINLANQNNINTALKESSAGNLGALSSNLLASNLNKNKVISQGYFQGREQNRTDNKFKFNTELDVDKFNASLDLDFIKRKEQDKGAFESAKIANRNAIFENIGAVSKEASDRKIVKKMFGYKWNGEYWVDKKGEKADEEINAFLNKKSKQG